MKRCFFIFVIFLSILRGNQYDYLLFSHVLSDVQRGVELGADTNVKWAGSAWTGNTPLYEAVKYNRLEIAYLLIMNRAYRNLLAQLLEDRQQKP